MNHCFIYCGVNGIYAINEQCLADECINYNHITLHLRYFKIYVSVSNYSYLLIIGTWIYRNSYLTCLNDDLCISTQIMLYFVALNYYLEVYNLEQDR